jgi:hypothetical protein
MFPHESIWTRAPAGINLYIPLFLNSFLIYDNFINGS